MAFVDRLRQLLGQDRPFRSGSLLGLAEPLPKGEDGMSIGGLRQRLESLEGVASIHLELAEAGLSGIRVSLDQGADEAIVLERIRSLLVTYGLRSPTPIQSGEDRVIDLAGDIVTSIAPDGDGMRVEVSSGGQSVVKIVGATPLEAAQAIAEGRARLTGRPVPKVLWIGLDAIGEWRVLTVLLRQGEDDVPSVGASIVAHGWAEALDRAVDTALG